MENFTIEKLAAHSYSLPESFRKICGLPTVTLRVLDVIYAHSFHPRAVSIGLTSVSIKRMTIEGGFGEDASADAAVRTELNRLKAFGLITGVYRPDPAEQFIARKGKTIALSNLYRLNTEKIDTCINKLNMEVSLEEIYDNETFYNVWAKYTITDPYDKAVFRASYTKDYKGAKTLHDLYLYFLALIKRGYKQDLIQDAMWKAVKGKPYDIAKVASSWVKKLEE